VGQAHNDWLEMLTTFGIAGSVLVLAAFGLVLAQRFGGGGLNLGRTFPKWIYLAMGSCLLYAAVDFPFTIYSILFLFVVECTILATMSESVR
jgi:O-antigen ligase